MRNTEPTAQTSPHPDLIPLSHLVLEGLAATIDELADRLGEEVVLVDDIGRRCTTRETARRLLAEHAEAKAEMEAHWRREREKTVRLSQEAQARVRRGVPAPEGLEHLSAAALLGVGAAAERLDAAGERYEEYFSGDVYFHPIRNEEEG
jgi:hypothetical protein